MHTRKRWAPLAAWAGTLVLLAALAGCDTLMPPPQVSPSERFDQQETHSRLIDASDAKACEAARRALLSQGYVINAAGADAVTARKAFQPERETHVEIEMRVVCVREGARGDITTLFVSGTEERYAVKKSSTSASVGVGAIGSLSLPFTGGDEALVKVAAFTITQPVFYDRFYALLYRFLERSPLDDLPAAGEVPPP